MGRYFCGWYFRCQSEFQTLAVIASCHKTAAYNFCEIQLVTDTESFSVPFPYSAFAKTDQCIRIADNYFSPGGVRLNIQTTDLCVNGNIQFGPFRRLSYDIMGPFLFFPFMQCRHRVYSMHHTVNGEITINGKSYFFPNAIGYMEGDRGRSFPRKYVWTQCSFPDGALMLSIADIPLGAFRFTGVIGFVYLGGKEYRLATYLGAKALKMTPDEIIVRQGSCTLIVRPAEITGHPLRAPVSGAMNRTIYEHPSCSVSYQFEKDGRALLELDAANAALEYEY